jgi:hypothetical protein
MLQAWNETAQNGFARIRDGRELWNVFEYGKRSYNTGKFLSSEEQFSKGALVHGFRYFNRMVTPMYLLTSRPSNICSNLASGSQMVEVRLWHCSSPQLIWTELMHLGMGEHIHTWVDRVDGQSNMPYVHCPDTWYFEARIFCPVAVSARPAGP